MARVHARAFEEISWRNIVGELVTIAKEGEPTLRISLEALAEHIKLGWQREENEIEAEVALIEQKIKRKRAE